MVLRQAGAILLMIIVLRMTIKDGRPRVNAKPYRPNICTVQLRGQIFGRPSIERPRVNAAIEISL